MRTTSLGIVICRREQHAIHRSGTWTCTAIIATGTDAASKSRHGRSSAAHAADHDAGRGHEARPLVPGRLLVRVELGHPADVADEHFGDGAVGAGDGYSRRCRRCCCCCCSGRSSS